MNILVDILLLFFVGFFRDSPAKRQKEAFKNRKAIAEAKKQREGDSSMTYIILDDLHRHDCNNGDFQYHEPPEHDFHCDDGGPDW